MLLGGLVGTAIVVLNIDRVAGGVEQLADVDISAGWLTAAKLLVGAIGVAATVRGALRARRARAAGVDAENEHEPAAQDPDPAPQSAN